MALGFYEHFQRAYDFYNEKLFNNELEDTLICFQRKANTFGYISYNRLNIIGGSEYVHELALNPDYFAYRTIAETLSTLVHEQCHLYQHIKGTDSRKSYHNDDFRKIMFERGLQTSSTGEEGGKQVGQKVSHYILPDGLFLKHTLDFLKDGEFLTFYDRVTPDYIEPIQFYSRSIKFIKRMDGRMSVEDIIPPYLLNHIKENPSLLEVITGVESKEKSQSVDKDISSSIEGSASTECSSTEGGLVDQVGADVQATPADDVGAEPTVSDLKGEDLSKPMQEAGKASGFETEKNGELNSAKDIARVLSNPEQLLEPLQELVEIRKTEMILETVVKKAKNTGSKEKFSCGGCGSNLWGKPSLNVICGDCQIQYVLVD